MRRRQLAVATHSNQSGHTVDYFTGNITIGGSISAENIQAFLDKAAESGASSEFASDAVDSVEEFVTRYGFGRSSVELMSHNALGGQFPNLEEFCRKLGLSYLSRSDGYLETPPLLTWWKPGMDEPTTIECAYAGVPVVPLSEIVEAMSGGVGRMPRFAPPSKDTKREAMEERQRRLEDLVKRYTPLTVPPLVIDSV